MTHGSYVTYNVHKCRCPECREANRVMAENRTRRAMYGRSWFVPTDPVRKRWQQLRDLGMNDDEIERAAGVSHHTSHNLFRGHHRTGLPVTRMKRETAERIMAVRHRALKPGQYIDAPGFPELTLDLMEMGYSAAWIARRIGRSYQGRGRLLATRVKAETYAALKRLHDSTTTAAPESSEASRSRNFAEQMRHPRRRRVA